MMFSQAAIASNPAFARRVGAVVVGSLLLTLSAKVQVPFYPVPMSMQSFVAIGLGLAFGSRLGAAAVFAYLLQGAAGLPVFASAHGAGFGYLFGPTGGYLVGFLLAAIVAGGLKDWAQGRIARLAGVSLLASMVLYVPGLAWLGGFTGYGKELFLAGAAPFLLGDALKTVLLATAFGPTAKLLSNQTESDR
ncbi:biotin transporter BioY [Mesorhizobium sp. CCNWLW179-1]|uniref:biotin transporter BioY n=1 Tax=unclassified Mesorhizobium TaxID=325217 RepID=UPI0030156D43